MILTVELDRLNLDFQLPECLNEETVMDYQNRLKNGEVPPPVEVRFDGVNHFLQDDMDAEFCEAVKTLKEQLRRGGK